MKKIIDKLLSKIKLNKKIFLFLIIISFIAFISGSILVVLLDKSDKSIIDTYLTNFINNMSRDKIEYLSILKDSLISNLGLVLVIWLLGISVIGIPIILFMYFTQIFTFGFLLSSIFLKYKFKGIILALLYTVPYYLIYFITLIILTSYAFKLSIKLINSIIKKKQIDFRIIFNKYLWILLFSSITIIISSLYESFIFTNIIKLIAPLFK